MADPKFADNPWSADFWNLTQQGAYIRKYGLEVAKTKARQAGTRLGAPRPVTLAPFTRNFILIKKIGTTVSGGGGSSGGQGSSGVGPP
jgi:uncharacterized membrane protein YgcG